MIWLTIVAVSIVTFTLRVSFIATLKPHAVPAWVQELLRYVAPAVLAAIVVPPIFVRDHGLELGLDNPRLAAALVAAAIAWFGKSVVATVLGGMGTLWLMQWLMGT
jgi:branched-subunit amino acid transport protein